MAAAASQDRVQESALASGMFPSLAPEVPIHNGSGGVRDSQTGRPASQGGYSFETCTMHVQNIPDSAASEVAVRAAVKARLQGFGFATGKRHKVIQVTFRQGDADTKHSSWALLTLSAEGAVKMVLSQPLQVGGVNLSLEPVDCRKVERDTGPLGDAYHEARATAEIEVQRSASHFARIRTRNMAGQRMKGNAKAGPPPVPVLESGWNGRFGSAADDAAGAGTPRVPGMPSVPRSPRGSRRPGAHSERGTAAGNRWHRARVHTKIDAMVGALRGFGDEPPKSLPRPGKDLPPHWPTSPRSRHRFTLQRSGRLAATASASEMANLKEDMRTQRLHRQRENAVETYRTAFNAIDVDGSGKVDPNEIVKFASSMGKRVDTRRFWRLFNELDRDNSADLGKSHS